MENSPGPRRCPDCDGERVAWSIHRTGTRAQRHSPREVHWLCRACGHAWSEPTAGPEDPSPLAPHAA
jgi:hypothetical protein